ncbi:hypothetical protein VHEMI01853 [[Torrubiella] hemipterigena]|uniref:Uncharacterized protein n=1 Tax=[Torrubiella] hemipterigena TaxID=1531966 RepID=A0A0A1T6I6_9HYPO|nr:hypothetical protein VHEMI01853 [[Torrubiella] hemipterigena]
MPSFAKSSSRKPFKNPDPQAEYFSAIAAYDQQPHCHSYQTTGMPYAPNNDQPQTYHHQHSDSHSSMASSSSAGSSGNGRWLSSVKTWLSTSEPSAQAMKKQRRDTYKKHGVSRSDPHAAEKMHLPMGKVPKHATTSTSGPTPEELIFKERKQRPEFMKHTHSAHSVSSGYSSGPSSLKETNPVAPWDEQ